jgi:hypothetical protein
LLPNILHPQRLEFFKSQVLLWISFLPQPGLFNHPHSEKREYLRPFIT